MPLPPLPSPDMEEKRATVRVQRIGDDVRVFLDPAAFSTAENAIAHARFAEEVLTEVLRGLERRLNDMDRMLVLWLMSAAQRASGLHVALIRETSWDNMHATFALLRAFVDTVLVTFEVAADPSYVQAIIHDPTVDARGRRRKKAPALIDRAKRLLLGVPDAWDYLSASGGHAARSESPCERGCPRMGFRRSLVRIQSPRPLPPVASLPEPTGR